MALKTGYRADTLTKAGPQNRKLAVHLKGVWQGNKIHKIERMERVDSPPTMKGWRIWHE